MVPKDWYCNGQHSVLKNLMCGGAHMSQHSCGGEWTTLWSLFFFLFMGTGVWTQVTRLLWQLPFSVKPPPCLAKTALSLNAPALFLGREALLIWLCFGNLVHVSYLAGPFAITFFLFSQQSVLWCGFSLRLASSALLFSVQTSCAVLIGCVFCIIPLHSHVLGGSFLFPSRSFFQFHCFFQSFLPSHLHHLPSPCEYLSPLLNTEPL